MVLHLEDGGARKQMCQVTLWLFFYNPHYPWKIVCCKRVILENLNFRYATDLKLGNLLNPVVPKHLGTRDQFHGREFVHDLGQGDGLEIILIRSSQP